MESLKAASSAAGTPSSSAELLTSLSSLEEQLQAVMPEMLPAVLEGTHLGVMLSEHLLLKLHLPVLHAHSCLRDVVHVLDRVEQAMLCCPNREASELLLIHTKSTTCCLARLSVGSQCKCANWLAELIFIRQ